MKYNFDKIIDRRKSKCRKWDKQILKEKFGLEEDAIAMDIADLDFETAPAIKKALVDRANIGDYSYTYTYEKYYDAIINWNKNRYDVDLKKEWIKLTFGTCSTLHHIVACFCKKNDSVMINTPAYKPFAEAIEMGKCKIICNSLKLENMRYYLDFENIEKQIVEENVKLYIFCSPQNPSGRVWTKDELNKLSDICLKHNVLLVCDEVHRDIVFDKNSFTSLWNCNDNIIDNSIMCLSPNKGFNLGGLKSSYVIIKNEKIRNKFLDYLKKVYITSPHVFAIPALIAAYEESEDWLNQVTSYIYENFNILYKWFDTNFKQAKVMKADSSFLVWIDMRDAFVNEEQMQAFFKKANISTVVGSYFVKDGIGWVRLNIGCPKKILNEALKRIGETLKNFDFKNNHNNL